jgi:hypothetical protein
MRKIGLLIAAALLVSTPIIVASPTDSFAAPKAAKKPAATAKQPAPAPAASTQQNGLFFTAVANVFRGQSSAVVQSPDKKGKKSKKG